MSINPGNKDLNGSSANIWGWKWSWISLVIIAIGFIFLIFIGPYKNEGASVDQVGRDEGVVLKDSAGLE